MHWPEVEVEKAASVCGVSDRGTGEVKGGVNSTPAIFFLWRDTEGGVVIGIWTLGREMKIPTGVSNDSDRHKLGGRKQGVQERKSSRGGSKVR